MKAKRILFLGNSITRHAPKADIGWAGNWGMAASAESKDYVRLLTHRFAEKDGIAPEVRTENIADFEREYRTYDIKMRLKPLADFNADIVVLAIGENVPTLVTEDDKAAFRSAVTCLLKSVTGNGTSRLYIRSSFWPNAIKDDILGQVCRDAGGTFVDISFIGRDEKNYARTERQIAHSGVAAHPGDAGMAAIAAALWNAMSASPR